MGKETVLSIISNANDDSIYLSDVETHELIYLNPAACSLAGVSETEYQGRKCYEVLQGLDAPCPFCTNHLLCEEHFYTWEHSNIALGRQFLLRDRLVRYQDRLVRLEIATDITHCSSDTTRKAARLQAIDEALVLCIDTLKGGKDTQGVMNKLLHYIGMFYQADFACIYEADYAAQTLSCTYSWLRENSLDNQRQQFNLKDTAQWFEAFTATGFISISSVEDEIDHNSMAYRSLQARNIRSLISVPLLDTSGTPIGLIGVGNPTANTELSQLLRAVSIFIVDAIGKRSMLERLERLSYKDPLTGVYNRARYLERIQGIQNNSPSSLGIICLDIDGIKHANDTYGHAYGDTLLVRTANILTGLYPQDVYRVGGDQFVVLCPGISREGFQLLTERLRRCVQETSDLSVSIGSKWAQGQVNTLEQIADTDKLMSLEKQSHYHARYTDPESRHARLAQKLEQELRDGCFTVVLQPLIFLKTGQVIGAEALVRKRGSAGELVSPAMFIPFYEAEGLVQAVDFYVLETVCRTLAGWLKKHFVLPRVSVNFSRVTLMDQSSVQNVSEICSRHQISPECIDIEMTESSSQMDLQALALLVRQLRETGFSVSLDDFGTQYSNLAILSNIDFDSIKIDKSLVDGIATNRKAHTIVEHIISLGKALNRTSSIAEGIEIDEQFSLLSQLECDVGQGYYFSKPLPIPEFCQRYLVT